MGDKIKIGDKMSIFKSYDIRGIYPAELNEGMAYKIGRAFVTFLKCKQVCIGQDARLSSPKLYAALVKGIMEQGADVVSIGLCTTPLFYFAARNYESGIMVTASHNPAEYNGFKLCRNGTVPLSGETGIQDIKVLVEKNKFQEIMRSKYGKITKMDYLDEYIRYNLKYAGDFKKLKIVVDTGNGMGGYTFPKLFERLPKLKAIPLFWDIDFNFPNHEANPLKPENMKDLQEAVKKHNADIGVAVDGDADRCVFVDEKGEIVPADFSAALIGLMMLEKHPGGKMLYDVRCSKVVKEVWEAKGARTEQCRVGHSFIKEQMRRQKAFFAGELSGHYYYEENAYTENSILSMLMMLNLISREKKPLSKLVEPLRKYSQSGEINSEVEDKEAKMKELEKVYKKQAKKIYHIDGISIEFDDWWFNVRPSNTEPLLRLNLEAGNRQLMERKRDELLRIIRS